MADSSETKSRTGSRIFKIIVAVVVPGGLVMVVFYEVVEYIRNYRKAPKSGGPLPVLPKSDPPPKEKPTDVN